MVLFGCSSESDGEVHGRALFETHCADCHEGANPDLLKQPPRLHHLFVSKTLPSGAPSDDKQVRSTILRGKGTMPAFDGRLSDEDLADLLKYLHSL
jgi:cytochrome c6